jgi:hypothetical protein
MDLPKNNKSNKEGRKGVTILTSIVENQLNWLLRINHQEGDFGIDAYIDIVTDEGHLTGKFIAVQVKSGKSYFKSKTDYGWKYFGENKHLNYYLNHEIPVILVMVDTETQKAYWEICDAGQTEKSKNGWTIVIPFSQVLNTDSKQELLQYVSPTIDYVSQLENQWEIDTTLKKFKRVLLIVAKNEVLNLDYKPLIKALSFFTSKKNIMYKYRGRVEIAIHGYDKDKRQLYEIKEVRKWVKKIFDNVKGLTFFLVNDPNAQFLRLFLLSQIKFDVVEASQEVVNDITRRKVEYESKDTSKLIYKLFDDLNPFCEYFKVSMPVNKEISENIINFFSGGEYLKNNKSQGIVE